MPRRTRTGQCVYCAARGVVTSDHVPPKAFFPPKRRVNLLTVNACPTCHDGFKLDDEYFRVAISIRDDLPHGPDAQFLRDQTKKTLRDPAASRFRASILRATTRVPTHTPAGLYLGHRVGLVVDGERLQRSARRIIKALFAKRFNRVVPQTHQVDVSLFDLQRDQSAILHPDVQEILGILYANGSHSNIGEVFEYWYGATDDELDTSVWFCRLHTAFEFVGWTTPRDA